MSASASPFGFVRSLAIGTATAALATAQSIPLKSHSLDREANGVRIEWESETGASYTFWNSSNLTNWKALNRFVNAAPGTSTTHSEAFDFAPTRAFFKVSRNSDAAPSLPAIPFSYTEPLPPHFTANSFPFNFQLQNAVSENDNTPLENSTTNEGAALGRVLFYDKKLSSNQTLSCASCHQQELGFSDPHIKSKGFEDGFTRRRSMALGNAAFYKPGKFFWDERAATLEAQVLQPIQDPVEMGMTLSELVAVVSAQSYYPPLFQSAFGDPVVTSERISRALAQFVRSLVSSDSRYDRARARVSSPLNAFPVTDSTAGANDSFTAEENLGKELFMRRTVNGNTRPLTCIDCHVSEAFVSPWRQGPRVGATSTTVNNGLSLPNSIDRGVRETTGDIADSEKFKMPSLRNIAIRPPYMHDGSLGTLEEVVEHYSSGIQPHPNLQQPLLRVISEDPQVLEAIQLNFSTVEKAAIVAFLKTLTDDTLLTHEKFSDPFD